MNKKIQSFDPLRFAPFAGESFLFDTPGCGLAEDNGLPYLRCNLDDPQLALYSALAKAAEDFAQLLKPFEFCPLPPETYHVTLADGVNVDNIGQVTGNAGAQFRQFLDGL